LIKDAVKRKAPKDLPFPAALRTAAVAATPDSAPEGAATDGTPSGAGSE
jgi:hypothetical protein